MKIKPVITMRFNAEGVKTSKDGKESNFVSNWAAFRAKLPKEK